MHQALQKNYSTNLHPLHNLQDSWLLDHTSILHELPWQNVPIQMFSLMVTLQYVLMELIKKELKSWSETLRIDNVPKAPTG